MGNGLDAILELIERQPPEPVYLVSGDPVLAEPAGRKLAEAIAARGEAQVETVRRPTRLADLLGDLRTYSLFGGSRVMLVLESALLADRRAAAALVDEIVPVLPVSAGEELDRSERTAAGRLLQVLRLFDVDPYAGGVGEAVSRLPQWALEGGGKAGRRKRTKQKIETLRAELPQLLAKARQAGLQGSAESDLAELAEILDNGLPAGHALVLAESAVSIDHPVVAALKRRRAVIDIGRVESSRQGGWQGVEALARQLGDETGVSAASDALDELARRTLQKVDGGRDPGVKIDSTARFAAEYRKLAALAAGDRITLDLVHSVVEDRGEEDPWTILDAVGAGRPGEALRRVDRYLAAAEDETKSLFILLGLLAGFCRQLTAISGLMRLNDVPAGVDHYGRFRSSLAPKLQAPMEGGEDSPLKGLHPYRLHRAYLAASRLPEEKVARLPERVLLTELRLKGESRDARSALAQLIAELATAK